MQISSQRERNEEGARWRVKSSYVQWSPISNGTRERRRFAARVEPAQKASNNGACRHCWSRRGATSAGRAPHLASPVFHFISTSTVVGSKRISFVRWSNTAYNIKPMELSLHRESPSGDVLWRKRAVAYSPTRTYRVRRDEYGFPACITTQDVVGSQDTKTRVHFGSS